MSAPRLCLGACSLTAAFLLTSPPQLVQAEPPAKVTPPGKAEPTPVAPERLTREAIASTDGLIRAGEKAIAREQLEPRALREVQIYQSAAELAQGQGKLEAAVWLTLEARRLTRAVFQARGLPVPAGHVTDRPGESALARQDGAPAFIQAIRDELPPLPDEDSIVEEHNEGEPDEEP